MAIFEELRFTEKAVFEFAEHLQERFPFLEIKPFPTREGTYYIKAKVPGTSTFWTYIYSYQQYSKFCDGMDMGMRYMELKEANKNNVLSKVYSEQLKRTG